MYAEIRELFSRMDDSVRGSRWSSCAARASTSRRNDLDEFLTLTPENSAGG